MELEVFLKVSGQFRLGELVTEQPHPLTTGLAESARNNLAAAIDAFHEVDLRMLGQLETCLDPLPELVAAMKRTLAGGGRIFIAGCGATGRLALSLETLAREDWLRAEDPDRIIGFMAGGDAALIRSIEAFEDYPEYGKRQLGELGFAAGDLLLAITEGGETPFVIGACLAAAEKSAEPPWFLFCNPPDLLGRLADRSREVLESARIRCLFLDTGPMALAGSTRLQATTAQMLVAGAALSEALGREPALELVERFSQTMQGHDPEILAPFIEAEAHVYENGDHVLYQTDRYGITVLTDTTERSPTFSLAPFESRRRPADAASWCYLSLPAASDSAEAWHALLHRAPRTLEWPDLAGKGSMENLLGHDISVAAPAWRKDRCPDKRQYPYLVAGTGPTLEFAGHSRNLGQDREPLLLRHLLLKCCLNLQSTLVMGRLGLFESNLMTRVRPSNYKLIDRAARHAQYHHVQKTGSPLPYEEAVRQVFASLH
jgi:N-acetylmuramic acid 6-phosphate etherase